MILPHMCGVEQGTLQVASGTLQKRMKSLTGFHSDLRPNVEVHLDLKRPR